jgi:hypothetical protein
MQPPQPPEKFPTSQKAYDRLKRECVYHPLREIPNTRSIEDHARAHFPRYPEIEFLRVAGVAVCLEDGHCDAGILTGNASAPTDSRVTAVFVHIVPTIVQSRLSPGIYTAALLHLPLSPWALVGSTREGVARTAIALVAGTLMMSNVVLGAGWLSNVDYKGGGPRQTAQCLQYTRGSISGVIESNS